MKKIISYKLFESSESIVEIKQYIKDILLELDDIGFITDVTLIAEGYFITLMSTKRFEWDDIDETILTLDSYLISIGLDRIDRAKHNGVINFPYRNGVMFKYSTAFKFKNENFTRLFIK